jgi:hypothetical protein
MRGLKSLPSGDSLNQIQNGTETQTFSCYDKRNETDKGDI